MQFVPDSGHLLVTLSRPVSRGEFYFLVLNSGGKHVGCRKLDIGILDDLGADAPAVVVVVVVIVVVSCYLFRHLACCLLLVVASSIAYLLPVGFSLSLVVAYCILFFASCLLPGASCVLLDVKC